MTPKRNVTSRIVQGEGAKVILSGLIPCHSMYDYSFRGNFRGEAGVLGLNSMGVQHGAS